tara:strand:+ start:113 stop:277 length:165 start_codon:yes stop_codon:yes gene_type:complete
MNRKEIKRYLIDKYMGGGANKPPAKNIKYELEDGYEFGYTTVFGKQGLTIKKKA